MNAHKYDGVHYQVVTMNMRDGSVQGHAHGCADLKRGKAKFAEPSQANDFMDVESKHDAWLDYNADFIAECEHDGCDPEAGRCNNAYDIQWLPCADAVPAFTEEQEVAAFTEICACGEVVTGGGQGKCLGCTLDEAAAAQQPQVTTRVGRKWTYVFVDGEEVAYVRNDMVALVLATLGA